MRLTNIRPRALRRASVACALALALPAHAQDLATGNAALEIVIPTVAPVIFQDVSPTGGDAPLVLRITTLTTNAWFDAVAPYHPTAVGVYSRIERQPPPTDNASMNVALLYASHEVFSALLPRRQAEWDAMLANAGLDPANDTIAPTTPAGVGNAAGKAVVAGRIDDGMNQTGLVGRSANPQPYRDTTGYVPLNTPALFWAPGRWQPDTQRVGLGLYKSQEFVTPQWSLVEPYSYDDPFAFRFEPPRASDPRNRRAYRDQAREVLGASASLTDEQKLTAELFDDKIASLGFSAVFAAQSRGLSLFDFVAVDFLTNMAAFDAGIVVWQEKRRYDAVRPFSAIAWLWGDRPVTAWGGVGQGTTSLPANEWKSYLEEADHPEYPSASTCFCTAHAQAARRFFGSDTLGYPVPYAAGASRVEPGIVPAAATVLTFPTWTAFAEDCGQSRVWAGVHFQAAVDESARQCGRFGDSATDYLNALIAGTAPARGPSEALPDRLGRFPRRH